MTDTDDIQNVFKIRNFQNLMEMIGMALIEAGETSLSMKDLEKLVYIENKRIYIENLTTSQAVEIQREAMKEILGPFSNHYLPWFKSSIMCMELGYLVGALIACDEGLRLEPNFALGWALRGSILFQGSKELSKAHLANRFRVDRKSKVELEAYLGSPLAKESDFLIEYVKLPQLSADAYQKAVDLEPENAIYWANLGYAFKFTLDRKEETEGAYLKAIELDSQEPIYWLALYEWYLNGKRQDNVKRLEKRAKEYKLDLKKAYKEAKKKSK